jgi:hypothetical protein
MPPACEMMIREKNLHNTFLLLEDFQVEHRGIIRDGNSEAPRNRREQRAKLRA